MSRHGIREFQRHPPTSSEDDCTDVSVDDEIDEAEIESTQRIRRIANREAKEQGAEDVKESRKDELVQKLATVAISGSSVKTGPGTNPEQLNNRS